MQWHVIGSGDYRTQESFWRLMRIDVRAQWRSVALETTLLVHGVPRQDAMALHHDLCGIVRQHSAEPALIGVLHGEAIVGMTDDELRSLLAEASPVKTNSANMGLVLHRKQCGATTVSGTMELSALADIRLMATGGVGGVHHGYGHHLDISADLAAFTRFPVGVVASGVKSILDVVSTREAFETLGIPVVGFQTETFPAFYLRDSDAGVDASFDDVSDLSAFVHAELERTQRGVLIVNPIPKEAELNINEWERWLTEATDRATQSGAVGRGVTPAILAALHDVSDGKTLAANLALVKANARLAAQLAR